MKLRKSLAIMLTAAMLTSCTVLSVGALTGEEKAVSDGTYILMNIPYSEFYQAELNNDTPVDVFTSATKSKVRSGMLSGGSYHADSSGDRIEGITFPVKVSGNVDLSSFTQVTDSDKLSITVTNRGKESTTEYSGSGVLYERPTYSYYVMNETPAFYKEMKQNSDGSFSFGKVQGEVSEITAGHSFTKASNYGDYQLNFDSEELQNVSTVYGVIISTKEGNDYGLRHLENIWRNTSLAWCTGYTDVVHGCTTSSAHYEGMTGQTINEVTYFTSDGIKKISGLDIYVDPVKYALMNIPYADFYKNETNINNPRAGIEISNDVPVDIFTSATKSKPLMGTRAGGSYHVNEDGSDITGIIYPVKLGDIDLSAYKQVTDSDRYEVTVSSHGKTTTSVYEGKDALFCGDSYSYYILDKAPAYCKTVKMGEDGKLEFSTDNSAETVVEGAQAELLTSSRYGDYQINTSGLEANTVYGVVLYTNEGNAYGLRHLENIWKVNNLAWCTGFTAEAHGCQTSSEHYKKIMGQTINKITYFTDEGKKTIPVDLYVPIKTGAALTAENTAASNGSTTYTQSGLAEDFDPVYTVTKNDSPVEMTVSNGTITFDPAKVGHGTFDLTVSDAKGKYAPVSAQFELTVPAPAVYNGDIISASPAIIAAEGMTDEQLSEYLSAIRSVTVNEQTYSAFGRGAVTVIDPETGKIDTSNADIFDNDTESFALTVSAAGYDELSFTIKRTADPENQSSDPEKENSDPEKQNSDPEKQNSDTEKQNSKPENKNSTPTSQNNGGSVTVQSGSSVTPVDSGSSVPSTADDSAAGIMLIAAALSVLTAVILGKKKKKEN